MPRGEALRKYRWQPGQSGNPAGRPPKPITEFMLRRFTTEHISEVFNQILELSPEELSKLIADSTHSAFEQAVAKAVENGRSTGDLTQIEKILDRCIGKVPQKLESELFGRGGAPLIPAQIVLQPVKQAEVSGE